MKSSFFKMAIAASIIAACGVGIFLWSGTQSVALADVLARINQGGAYSYRMKMSTTMTGDAIPESAQNQEIQGTILIVPEVGMKMTMEMLNDADQLKQSVTEQYILTQQNRSLMMMHEQKMYLEMELNDQILEKTKHQSYDPRMMVEQILECDYEELGRSRINGIDVEGFQTSDPAYMGGVLGEMDVTLWVDTETWLPVQMDMTIDMEMPMSSLGKMHTTGVLTDFQWDVAVDGTEFDPVIPDDYTSMTDGPLKMPEMDEATAIEGLRLYSKYTDRFPEDLNMMKLIHAGGEIMQAGTPAAQALKESLKGGDRESRSGELLKVTLQVQAAGGFYTLLLQDEKDPVYHGKIVTPEMPDAVLLRWKVSEDEYRVIFGDLEAETVTAAQLAELESGLPQ
ncbi:MAG: hypothetical protein IH892_18800 [Planctomycetes bacterium]|nr:hypothetical protein [Planctomycetota bacterium]